MATKLKNLSIEKVAVVDEGANPDAHIRMMKRKDMDALHPAGDSGKGSGNILKKMLAFIGKAAGMDQEEIESAVEEIEKGDSISFREKINEANNRKIYDEMWDVCYALQSALCSILNDEELDSTSTAASMQESLDQFYALAKDSIGKWSSGKAAEIVKKDDAVSDIDLCIMKSAVERLTDSIEKAGGGTGEKGKEKLKDDDKDQNNQEGDEEMALKINKNLMTDAEKAFYESIEKRYGVEEGQGTEPAGNTDGQGAEPSGNPGQGKVPGILYRNLLQRAAVQRDRRISIRASIRL